MKSEVQVKIADRTLKLSNLEKVLYPAAHFSKADVIQYYRNIAPVLLPHLKNRPLTLKRYPDGVTDEFFYEKNCPRFRPSWLKTAPVWSDQRDKTIQFCLVDDLAGLVWAANLASLELHTSLALAGDVQQPTMLVFDLDPGAPAAVLECAQVALWLKEKLDAGSLRSFAKTSGSKGLQVYVPLNTAVTYEQTKPFAHELARTLEREHPAQVVSNIRKALRAGKVFVDWSQNDAHKTTVCVYSLRAQERPRVSTPLTWSELELALRQRDAKLLTFECTQVLERVARHGDLFAPVLKLKQRLPTL